MEFTTQDWFVAGVVALVLLAVLWWKLRKLILFILKKKEAEGTITNWLAAMQKGKQVFYPMIEFESEERGLITFRAEEMSENEPMFPRGTKVKILYLPGDPDIRKVVYPETGKKF